MTGTWNCLSRLALRVESWRVTGLAHGATPRWTRRTSVVHLQGAGQQGVGEDVTWTGSDQLAFQASPPELPLAGNWTLESFSAHLEQLELWPVPPTGADGDWSRDYRRWAFESAALDLALAQAGTDLATVLARPRQPLHFVASLGLGAPPSTGPLLDRRRRAPGIGFKVDFASDWTVGLLDELAAVGGVDVVDLKGAYRGEFQGPPADPELYRAVAERLPSAWLEDPELTPECDRVLRPHRERVTWDATLHRLDDLRRLPFAPRCINVKPSRFATLRELCAVYDHCAEHGLAMYGGGQYELGPGRLQIQELASLFHPDGPNDVAPVVWHGPDLPERLPGSPLPLPAVPGFGRGGGP